MKGKVRLSPSPECSRRRLADMAKVGQPWRACQTITGDQTARAISAASQSQGLRKTRARPVTRKPTVRPISKKRIVSLLRRPTPTTSPRTGHSRSRPVRRMRMMSNEATVHASRS